MSDVTVKIELTATELKDLIALIGLSDNECYTAIKVKVAMAAIFEYAFAETEAKAEVAGLVDTLYKDSPRVREFMQSRLK